MSEDKQAEMTSRMSTGLTLVLKERIGSASVLMRVKTGNSHRQKTRDEIKKELACWMKNKCFDPYRKGSFDLALVVKLDEKRMEDQDVDNIAKRVLDALQIKRGEPVTVPHLFVDDSQVARLLVFKRPRKEVQATITDEVTISFRKHAFRKQMILETQRAI